MTTICLHHHVKVSIQWILGVDLTPGPGLTRNPSPGGRGEPDITMRRETLRMPISYYLNSQVSLFHIYFPNCESASRSFQQGEGPSR